MVSDQAGLAEQREYPSIGLPGMLPNFILIGAPRAGTTWIAKNLESHPEIFFPRKKEIHFFDYQYDKGLDFYESFFAASGPEPAIGEATPAYLHFEPAAERIKSTLPDAKLIVSLRNPIDRLYSRYWNSQGNYSENTGLSFEEKIEQKPIFIEEGFYIDHIRRYLDLFPRDQLLILLFDDLKSDPKEFMASIYRFVGVNDDYVPELLRHEINAAAKQKLVVKSRTLYWWGNLLRRLGFHDTALRIEQKNSAKLPPMVVETRQRLIETYREKNEQLAQLIGRDLSHWNS